MLNPVIDGPCLANPILNEMLLFYEELITLDCATGNEENMGVLDVYWVLEEELVDDHLYRFKLGSDDVDLRTWVTAWEHGALQFDRVRKDVVLLDAASLWYRV